MLGFRVEMASKESVRSRKYSSRIREDCKRAVKTLKVPDT